MHGAIGCGVSLLDIGMSLGRTMMANHPTLISEGHRNMKNMKNERRERPLEEPSSILVLGDRTKAPSHSKPLQR